MNNPRNTDLSTKKPLISNTFRAVLVAMGIALAIGAVALPAAARGVPASAATAVPASDIGCFSEFYGALTNACGSNKILRFSLPIDSTGYKDVWVHAQGATSNNNVSCQSFGVDPTVTYYWASPRLYLPAFGSTQTLHLQGAYVDMWGSLMVNCWVDPGGRVNNIHWNY